MAETPTLELEQVFPTQMLGCRVEVLVVFVVFGFRRTITPSNNLSKSKSRLVSILRCRGGRYDSIGNTYVFNVVWQSPAILAMPSDLRLAWLILVGQDQCRWVSLFGVKTRNC
jgi:hypothetical protein